MNPREVAERLLRAETEYRASQDEHDGTMTATARYQAAKRELAIAFGVARAVLDAELPRAVPTLVNDDLASPA